MTHDKASDSNEHDGYATTKTASSGKVTLILVFLAFFGPMALAMWMYFSGQEVKLGASNGTLLEPIVNINDTLPAVDALQSEEPLWRLAYVNEAECDEACVETLYIQRQSRKMLGREMDRLERLFLHGDLTPDTLFIESEHGDLWTGQDAALSSLLTSKLPAGEPTGGYFLIDPIGNIVLYFRPDMDPKDMVSDIKKLFKISQIG
ncbi:MAG: hypothetical protein AAGA44_01255 [Pseudomonadota bacterium]